MCSSREGPMRLPWRVCGLTFVLALLVLAPSATAATNGACSTPSGGDVRVTCGSPRTPFPQNKQNEPAVAIDAHAPNIVAAGSNEEIDLQPCPLAVPTNDVRCPFTTGVCTSGIYFSTDGGQTGSQPT